MKQRFTAPQAPVSASMGRWQFASFQGASSHGDRRPPTRQHWSHPYPSGDADGDEASDEDAEYTAALTALEQTVSGLDGNMSSVWGRSGSIQSVIGQLSPNNAKTSAAIEKVIAGQETSNSNVAEMATRFSELKGCLSDVAKVFAKAQQGWKQKTKKKGSALEKSSSTSSTGMDRAVRRLRRNAAKKTLRCGEKPTSSISR